ncbi:MAG: hypothetical protein ACKO2P_18425 [Planctomycetota bacterium]
MPERSKLSPRRLPGNLSSSSDSLQNCTSTNPTPATADIFQQSITRTLAQQDSSQPQTDIRGMAEMDDTLPSVDSCALQSLNDCLGQEERPLGDA